MNKVIDNNFSTFKVLTKQGALLEQSLYYSQVSGHQGS